MTKARKTRKFAAVKRIISPNDSRLRVNMKKKPIVKRKPNDDEKIQRVDATPSSLFFRYNTALGPPYNIIIDTNFINFSISNKLDIIKSMMDCLYAKCTPIITDCVMAELEKIRS